MRRHRSCRARSVRATSTEEAKTRQWPSRREHLGPREDEASAAHRSCTNGVGQCPGARSGGTTTKLACLTFGRPERRGRWTTKLACLDFRRSEPSSRKTPSHWPASRHTLGSACLHPAVARTYRRAHRREQKRRETGLPRIRPVRNTPASSHNTEKTGLPRIRPGTSGARRSRTGLPRIALVRERGTEKNNIRNPKT